MKSLIIVMFLFDLEYNTWDYTTTNILTLSLTRCYKTTSCIFWGRGGGWVDLVGKMLYTFEVGYQKRVMDDEILRLHMGIQDIQCLSLIATMLFGKSSSFMFACQIRP